MRYRRNRVAGGCYFFTVNLRNRKSDCLVHRIDELRDAVSQTKTRRPFSIEAWVVLPDHLHAVWALPSGDDDYSARWRDIKTRFTKAVGKSVWQNRFWEHTVRDEVDFRHHIDYVHLNPVKHGLVERAVDWPYSSFHRAVRKGLYSADWMG